jgi:mannose-1-phosphate guanylyltransferase/mannose-6-phosphate isomerase
MYPKQFIRFFNGQDRSFLAAALSRLKQTAGFQAPILLCNNDHRFLIREEVDRASLDPLAIILEPVARNTAPAIAVAALVALKTNPDAILAVMPSDHVVKEEEHFATAVGHAAEVAATGKLVLFGIKPTEAHTGYGYIKRGNALTNFEGQAFAVEAFAEKPDRATAEAYLTTGKHFWNSGIFVLNAKTYLADGNYFWNSGIFVLHAKTYLDEIERHHPEILQAVRAALDNAEEDLGFLRLQKSGFAAATNISVDYAVMEKTAAAAVLPLDVGWNDVGSWTSLWDIAPRDSNGNYVKGDALLEDTTDCYVHSEKAIVSTIGVKDLVIVDTPDALLVADKNRAQDVSKIVKQLKQSNRKEQEQHLRNYRPWGFFETLNIGPRFQVKLLHVNPGGKLSMQMHHHRSEHWIVVQGTAKVVIGEREQLLRENESVYIFATQWHRLENPGKVPVEIIEVQIGSYLGEDDILRTDDIYHRAPEETK